MVQNKAVFLQAQLTMNVGKTMKITLNNRPEEIEGGPMSVNELIKYKNYTFKLLVTKVNGQLVKTGERDEAMVNDGDNVQIMHLISGG